MASEMCPKCRQLQNVRMTVSRRKTSAPGGKTRVIRTSSLHCDVCGSFIRSEESEEAEKDEQRPTSSSDTR